MVTEEAVKPKAYRPRWYRRIFGLTLARRDLEGYMRRWVLSLPGGWKLRLHHIERADDHLFYHDHPFSFVSVVLWGWYVEERPTPGVLLDVLRGLRGPRPAFGCKYPEERGDGITGHTANRTMTRRPAGSIAFRRHFEPHRIDSVSPGGVWTFVISRTRARAWGFWLADGWVSWQDFYARFGVGSAEKPAGDGG